MTLGDVPAVAASCDRLRQRRAELGLPAGDDAPLLVDPRTGRAGRRRRAAAAPAQGPADPGQHRGQRQHLPRHAARPIRHTRTGRGARRTSEGRPLARIPPAAGRSTRCRSRPISGPLDVIVKIGGAGVCRTDLHIIEGQWDAAMGPPLPYTLGHENAGWVHEIGSAVTNVAVGDTVILHPTPTCGLCRACRAGDDMHCINSTFPGLAIDGGMAEYLLTSARACVKLDPETQPQDVAALADAGITAYHAVRKAIPLLYPGTTCVVIGAGGLGHIGIQCLAALTATTDHRRRPQPGRARSWPSSSARTTPWSPTAARSTRCKDLTDGDGADVVLDFVAEQGAENDGFAHDRGRPARTSSSATAARWTIPTLDIISTERNIIGNIVGTYNELAELMVAGPGRQGHPAHPDLPAGRRGRRRSAISTPAGSAAGPSSSPSPLPPDLPAASVQSQEDRWPRNCVSARTPGACCWPASTSSPRP